MNNKKKIAVLLTTYNRSAYTVKCIESLSLANSNLDFRFVVTDDNSSDDTVERLKELPAKIKILKGNGNLFWNGGMRKSINYAIRSCDKFDYCLLINDDVVFYKDAISKMVKRLDESGADVIVGATKDDNGRMSYGAVIKTSNLFAKFTHLEPTNEYEQCDTFNCNCVLLKSSAFKNAGNLDPNYTHSMGDYDYGMHIRNLGMTIIGSDEYVGHCNDNDDNGTWHDTTLSRKKRIELKEGPKGLPYKDWFHFVKKNYGFLPAVYHSITPYGRILLKK